MSMGFVVYFKINLFALIVFVISFCGIDTSFIDKSVTLPKVTKIISAKIILNNKGIAC